VVAKMRRREAATEIESFAGRGFFGAKKPVAN
jgi:hypothetical protein